MVFWSVQGQQGQVRNKTIIGLKLEPIFFKLFVYFC